MLRTLQPLKAKLSLHRSGPFHCAPWCMCTIDSHGEFYLRFGTDTCSASPARTSTTRRDRQLHAAISAGRRPGPRWSRVTQCASPSAYTGGICTLLLTCCWVYGAATTSCGQSSPEPAAFLRRLSLSDAAASWVILLREGHIRANGLSNVGEAVFLEQLDEAFVDAGRKSRACNWS